MSPHPLPTLNNPLPVRLSREQMLAVLRAHLRLTPAEAVVACHLPLGLTAQAIAERTGRRVSTVKRHMEHITGKTGVPNGRALASLITAVFWWAAQHPEMWVE